jgi:hypothetical protein
MLRFCHQNAKQDDKTKTANRSFENVAKFRYLGMTVTNRKLIQEDIMGRLILGYVWYHSVQNPLSSHLLSRNKNLNKQNYNFACSFVRVNLVSGIMGRTKTEGASDQGAEDNICTDEG